MKKLMVGETPINVQIWDTGGQERFRTITKNYYNKADGIALVYDCGDEKSYGEIQNWMTQIESHAKVGVVKILVAAKCDRPDYKVPKLEGVRLAEECQIPFFETSAKLGSGVKEAFDYIVNAVVKNEAVPEGITLESAKTEEMKDKGGCC